MASTGRPGPPSRRTSTSGSLASAASVGAINNSEIVIGHSPLRHQNHLCGNRRVQKCAQVWRWDLVGNDRRRADEMHRAGDIARKFEAWHGQLQVGVCKSDSGMEQQVIDVGPAPSSLPRQFVQAKSHRPVNNLVKVPRDGCMLGALFGLFFAGAGRPRKSAAPRLHAASAGSRCRT